MKRIIKFLLLLFIVTFTLMGCSEPEPQVSSLFIKSMSIVDPETDPNSYHVSFQEDPANIHLNFSVPGLTKEEAKSWEETYEIEEYELTDEKIRLVFNDTELDFEKLSESVLQTKDGTCYEYIETIE